MKNLLILLSLFAFQQVCGQPNITPNSKEFTFQLKPFEALYSQMGGQLHVRTSLSPNGNVYNIVMSMANMTNSSEMITDVMGLSSENGAFIYRDYHLLMPSWSYNRVRIQGGMLEKTSFNNEGSTNQSVETEALIFDGTFIFWMISGVDKSINEFTVERWKDGPGGIVSGASGKMTSDGSVSVQVGDRTYDCRKFVVEAAPGVKVITYVSDTAPYLIKQEYVQGSAGSRTVLELLKSSTN